MKSLLFCISKTSILRSAMAARTAAQRRSSSFVEIGLLILSASMAIFKPLLFWKLSGTAQFAAAGTNGLSSPPSPAAASLDLELGVLHCLAEPLLLGDRSEERRVGKECR